MKMEHDEIKKNLDAAKKYNRQARILSVIALIISLFGLLARIALSMMQ